MNDIANIIKEPRGKVYEALINYGVNHCKCFSLVWRDEFEPAPKAKKIEKMLKPFIIREEHTNKWPGTELIGHNAYVRYYRFTPESNQILLDKKSLYSWLANNSPEDLAFYSDNGQCVLGSIAHEKDSFIYLTEAPLEIVKKEIPGLKIKTTS